MTKIIFFGTPDYVLPILKALHKVIAVVTQPPKPTSRKKRVEYSPVDRWASKHKIPVIYGLSDIPDADLGILAAYGNIIPKKIINKFSLGILNIHPSILPKYRGASPVQAAIASGEKLTGVTVIKMDEEVDHGPIVSSFKEKILDDDTTESLRERLFERSSKFLIDLISNYLNKKIKLKPQDHKKATYTKPLTKQDGFIPPKYLESATKGKSLDRFIRAMYPWPIAWTFVNLDGEDREIRLSGHEVTKKANFRSKHKRLKIIKAHVENKKLVLDEVQLEGKNPVTWKQFKQGYPRASFSEE